MTTPDDRCFDNKDHQPASSMGCELVKSIVPTPPIAFNAFQPVCTTHANCDLDNSMSSVCVLARQESDKRLMICK